MRKEEVIDFLMTNDKLESLEKQLKEHNENIEAFKVEHKTYTATNELLENVTKFELAEAELLSNIKDVREEYNAHASAILKMCTKYSYNRIVFTDDKSSNWNISVIGGCVTVKKAE